MQRRRQPQWTNNSILFANITVTFFSARDLKPVPPPLPPAPIPMFNPREIQLGKKDALTAEEKNFASKQEVNPYRKAANGMD